MRTYFSFQVGRAGERLLPDAAGDPRVGFRYALSRRLD